MWLRLLNVNCHLKQVKTVYLLQSRATIPLNTRENNGQRFYLYGPKLDQGISLQALGIWSTHWVRITPDERSESHRDESVSHRLEESKVIVLAQNAFVRQNQVFVV